MKISPDNEVIKLMETSHESLLHVTKSYSYNEYKLIFWNFIFYLIDICSISAWHTNTKQEEKEKERERERERDSEIKVFIVDFNLMI
jgi:hypothetical protein